MNNINALLFSTSVIGASIQKGQINFDSINNFHDLVNNLIQKENEISISNILNQINSKPEILKSVYQAIATLNLYGQLKEASVSNTNELENNPIVNYILNNSNLNQEEKQIALNGIKIISEQIIKNYPVIYSSITNNEDSINNISTSNQQLDFALQETNTPLNSNIINDTENISPVNNSVENTNIQPPQILQSSNDAAKVITNGFISNSVLENKNTQPIILNKLPQEIEIINNNLKINIPDLNIKLENIIKIKNQISNILNLISDTGIDKNDSTIQSEIKNLENYVKELDNIITQINAADINDSEQLKNISNEISKIINAVFVSLINTAANLYNHQIYINNNKEQQDSSVNPISNSIKNNNYINSFNSQNSRQIYVSTNEDSQLKELISKIFLMLKEMNGELYIGKKIEYVYKPFSNQTSQITPDGILLINTANNQNIKDFIAIDLQQVINNKIPVNIINNSNNIIEQKSSIINSNNFDTVKSIISNPVSITHNYDIPKTFNITKDTVNQTVINTANKNYNSNIKGIIDEINTYFVNFIENKSEQKPVDTKIYEKVMDFSGKVRDDLVIKQIVKNIADAVKFNISEKIQVKMMLRPENLGPVIIKFEAKDNVINGRIDVASTVTKDILKANIVELKNSLNNLGYNIENLEIFMLNAYTSGNSHSNLYYNKQQQFPVYINNETIEDIGVIPVTDGYLNYLA